MDPFNKLPAEIRQLICLWLRFRPKGDILSLIKASPIMLQQYTISKAYLTKTALESDLDDEMIQDATRIILFPSWEAAIVRQVPTPSYDEDYIPYYNKWKWIAPQLPNPFKTGDHGLIAKIEKLHSRLLLFIEDYLTKATAVFPPREYLCLPDLSSLQGHLIFKDKTVCPRFDAARLTNQERRRLLRAFLRHELICKVKYAGPSSTSHRNLRSLFQYGGQRFQQSDGEAIDCVHEYLVSLYGAIFAQCGDSWLPEIPEGTPSSHNTGLLFPDNFYVDAESYASDIHSRVSPLTASFGFDLATLLISDTISGQHERDRLKTLFKSTRLGRNWGWCRFAGDRNLKSHTVEVGDRRREEPSGMYQMLSSRILDRTTLQREMYRQRAWMFLDDDRLYPSSGLAPHFPTYDELEEQYSEAATNEEWFSDPNPTRARHRSRKLHEKRCSSVNGDQRTNKPQVETEGEKPAPLSGIVLDQTFIRGLPPFWR